MERVSENIYVATEYVGNNVGIIITESGIVLIEAPMLYQDARDWQARIRDLTDKPIIYLINTHHHLDHIIGNSHFNCPIISHRNAVRGIEYIRGHLRETIQIMFPEDTERWEAELSRNQLIYPQITFSQELTLHLGITIELRFMGGHTASSLVVYIPSDKVLFTGDNVTNGVHPFMGQARLNIWQESIEHLLALEVEAVVPGHGPVGDKEVMRNFSAYLDLYRQEMGRLKEAGHGPEEIPEMADRIIDFFPTDPKERSAVKKMMAAGMKNLYGQIV